MRKEKAKLSLNCFLTFGQTKHLAILIKKDYQSLGIRILSLSMFILMFAMSVMNVIWKGFFIQNYQIYLVEENQSLNILNLDLANQIWTLKT